MVADTIKLNIKISSTSQILNLNMKFELYDNEEEKEIH